MLKAHLLHNPSAGDEEHSEEELISLIESHGFKCRYSSTKKNEWKDIDADTDLFVIAGGDGTIRKIVKELLKTEFTKIPIGILPRGTANNIAKAFNIHGSSDEMIVNWKKMNVKKFSVGEISNIVSQDFFIEGMGFGLFPFLIKEMKKQKKDDIEDPAERLEAARQLLMELASEVKPFECRIEADGKLFEGRYILAEVMNIPSLGPNLILATHADTTDNAFEVVLVQEDSLEAFQKYLADDKERKRPGNSFVVARASDIILSASSTELHVDDKLPEIKSGTEISINISKESLSFLV